MTAKRVESLRQKEANNVIVRLLCTKPFIDDKWLIGITHSDLKKYLVIKYNKDKEKYIPVWNVVNDKKVQWWDATIHSEIKKAISGYDDQWSRERKDEEKIKKITSLFHQQAPEYFHSDDFIEAQNKYIQWCSENGVSVSALQAGSNSGDD